jgi:protease IV
MNGLVQAARRIPGRHAIVTLVVVAALAAAAGVRMAAAQTLSDLPDAAFRPTRGVFLPQAARTGDADATAIELNPGQLGLARQGDFAGVLDLSNGNSALPGRGAAVLMSAPIVDGLGFGAGLQHLFGGGGWRTSGFTKLQLGLGLAGRNFGVGASWGHLWGFPADGVDTFDLGASARLFGHAALGVAIEDLNGPRLPGAAQRLARRWVAELALRPLGTDRLEIAAAALHLGGDAWSRLGSRFRAGWALGGAWRVFADLELAPRRAMILPPGQGAAGGAAAGAGDGTDVRLAAGVAVAFDHTGLALAGRRAFVPEGAAGAGWGSSLVIHQSVARNVPAAGPTTVVRLKLHHLDSDRAFLKRVLRLRALAGDPTVAAVLLEIDDVGLGVGRIEELRDLLTALRARGKRVVAYVTYPSTRDMYLAVASDRVVIHPAGIATFSGLAQTVTFYKEAMDHLGVRMDLIRIAEFKGAMEPFVMTGQSEAVKRNRNDLLDDLHGRIAAAVERARGIGAARSAAVAAAGVSHAMEALLARATFTPAEAKEAGLVDAILDDHEVEGYLRTLLGRPGIHIEDASDSPVRPRRWPAGRVAVILVDGTLVDGPSQDLPFGLGDTVGSDTLVAALEECRRDASVRAVVLRVNSPGGSAFASDVVARAVVRLRAAGKPVVASMGDVGASGGYYISAPTDAIFAEPSTTTGSIGIFGYKLDVAGLMTSLSLHTEVYRRGPHADAASPYRPWTPDERASAERKIRHLYGAFLQTVAAGRKREGLNVARVDELGRGHVYTAAQARPLGLVDELGGVTAAIDRAVTLGQISIDHDEAPELLVLPRPVTSLLNLATGLAQAETGTDVATEPTVASSPLRPAGRLLGPYLLGPGEGIEARLPYDLEMR